MRATGLTLCLKWKNNQNPPGRGHNIQETLLSAPLHVDMQGQMGDNGECCGVVSVNVTSSQGQEVVRVFVPSEE